MRIHVNHIDLNYTQSGSGSACLLLHGNGEDHSLFAELIPRLASRYTVYAIDARNHGGSQHHLPLSYQLMADDVLAFAAALHLQQLTLIGFSDGAIIAMLVASQQPDLVAQLVLAGGNLTPQGLTTATRVAMRFDYQRRPDPLLALMLKEPAIKVADLAKITARTLVLAGEHDVITPVETQAIAAGIANSTLTIVPGAGHSDYVVANRRLYRLIADHLQLPPIE